MGDEGTLTPSATNLPAPAEEISKEEIKEKLRDFLSSFGKNKARATFVEEISRQLDLEGASPQKLNQIGLEIENILKRAPHKTDSGQNAAAIL